MTRSSNEVTSGSLLEGLLQDLMRDDPAWAEFLGGIAYLWPPYRTEREHEQIRNESRWLVSHHAFAAAALEVRQSYVVGTGHTYTVRVKPGQNLADDVLQRIQAEIVDFIERDQWQHRQLENQWRLDRDGEVFIRLFDVDGHLAIRYVEPEQVASPPGSDAPFGVVTDPDDAETVRSYWVRRDVMRSDGWEEVPAEEIQHRKANCDRTMPRGLPVLFPVRDNLRRVWKLLRNMTTVAGIQAAVAILRMHGAAPAGSVQQYVARMAAASGTAPPSSQIPPTYERFPPGAIIDVPPGVEVKFPAEGINVANYVQAVQAELRAVAARLCLPEYMLSGDASNANYASTLVAEGPAVKAFERLQSQTIWWDTAILRKALEIAERAGRLPAGVSQQIIIDAEAPLVQSRDRLKEAQADQILLTMGVVSPQTVAARHGYDYEQEKSLTVQAEES
jgi:capsid protein